MGGERPIGLMAMLFRFAMRLHKGLIGQWDDAFHGHWDQAVRNSSCLRAAILRALKVEVGYLEGFDSLALLWDIAAFYDSIRLADLVRMGLDRSFPRLLLRLSLFGHCGPRAFKERQFIGSWIQVTDLSIVAGCITSVSHTRNILYNILDEMHRAYQPVKSILGSTTALKCMLVTPPYWKITPPKLLSTLLLF